MKAKSVRFLIGAKILRKIILIYHFRRPLCRSILRSFIAFPPIFPPIPTPSSARLQSCISYMHACMLPLPLGRMLPLPPPLRRLLHYHHHYHYGTTKLPIAVNWVQCHYHYHRVHQVEYQVPPQSTSLLLYFFVPHLLFVCLCFVCTHMQMQFSQLTVCALF